MKKLRRIFPTLAVGGMVVAAMATPKSLRERWLGSSTWQKMTEPGPLRRGHGFLDGDCRACHEPIKGVSDAKCASCHAANSDLLGRQTTAFHADIGNCRQCHPDHLGRDPGRDLMDHARFAKTGLKMLAAPEASRENRELARALSPWIQGASARDGLDSHPRVEAAEATLNCAACHSKQEPHRGYFGEDCAACHSTKQWMIAEFRHPSPRSTDCAQCHQAPPSHFMGHFNMVSMQVAGKERANVNQCFLCHRITSWNDIQGVGWYKHH